MAIQYASGKIARLTVQLNPSDSSLTANIDVGVTSGRFYLKNNLQEEWVSFSGVAASGSNYVYSNLVRGLSQTADPATAGTGLTWLVNQQCVLVAMHDQIMDKQKGSLVKVYANATARDADLTSPSNGMSCYNTADGVFNDYVSGAWVQRANGATANASTTVAGKVEIATLSELNLGTNTGGTGALLSALPSDIATTAQAGNFVFAGSIDVSDTYTASLTPALTTYTTGQKIRIKFTTANTGACTLNVNSLGAKSIKLIDGSDPLDGDIASGGIYELIYDGTNFVLQSVAVRASSAEALTGTNTVKFMTPSTTKDSIKDSVGVITTGLTFGSNIQASTSGIVAGYVRRNASTCRAECYVGAANPATTLVQISGSSSQDIYGAFSFPVKKGYYWRVDAINSPGESALTFTPNA